MARRSKKKSNSTSNLVVYLIIGFAVVAALIAGKFYLNQRDTAFADTSELPMSDYLENPNSFSGNVCRITGKITEKLKWTPDQGQLVAVYVNQSEKGKGDCAIRVPAKVDKINLERGHTYIFKVKINRAGLPVAIDIKAK